MQHVSVLKKNVQNLLNLKGGEIVVDATLGLGGHARDILESLGGKGTLIAFEQDERNLKEAKSRLKDFGDQVEYVHDNFRYLKTSITGLGYNKVDAMLFDLGLSSPHVDDENRGFSFMKDGPLDMRFDPRNKLTAAGVVNNYSEEELMKIFFAYGEEKMSKKIARKIVERRIDKEFSSTVELAGFISEIYPKKRSSKGSKAHPATKTFQALRIEVNDELEVLKEVLEQAVDVLKVGGRIAVMSYHSLEDRIVKHFFKKLERPLATPEEAIYSNYGEPIFKSLTKKPVVPCEEEIKENPRSRSAKLRVYEKLKEI